MQPSTILRIFACIEMRKQALHLKFQASATPLQQISVLGKTKHSSLLKTATAIRIPFHVLLDSKVMSSFSLRSALFSQRKLNLALCKSRKCGLKRVWRGCNGLNPAWWAYRLVYDFASLWELKPFSRFQAYHFFLWEEFSWSIHIFSTSLPFFKLPKREI